MGKGAEAELLGVVWVSDPDSSFERLVVGPLTDAADDVAQDRPYVKARAYAAEVPEELGLAAEAVIVMHARGCECGERPSETLHS